MIAQMAHKFWALPAYVPMLCNPRVQAYVAQIVQKREYIVRVPAVTGIVCCGAGSRVAKSSFKEGSGQHFFISAGHNHC